MVLGKIGKGLIAIFIILIIAVVVFGSTDNFISDSLATGVEVSCTVNADADILSGSDINGATCDTGDSCIENPFTIATQGLFDVFTEEVTLKMFVDGTLYDTQRDSLDRSAFQDTNFEFSACIPSDAELIEFELLGEDALVDDTWEIDL